MGLQYNGILAYLLETWILFINYFLSTHRDVGRSGIALLSLSRSNLMDISSLLEYEILAGLFWTSPVAVQAIVNSLNANNGVTYHHAVLVQKFDQRLWQPWPTNSIWTNKTYKFIHIILLWLKNGTYNVQYKIIWNGYTKILYRSVRCHQLHYK